MRELNCCLFSKWDQSQARDMGRVEEFELVLSRCSHCGAYWMGAYCVPVSTNGYVRVSEEDARIMLNLPPGLELKAFMKTWCREHV
jgi:hypothetical protein